MSKLERLLNLTAALVDTERPLAADEIQARVPGYPDAKASFHRAFERDKDDLREMGVPLTLEPISGRDPPQDGYRVRKEDYYVRDPRLEADELAALHLAASAVRLDGVHGIEALWKLGGEPATDGPAPMIAALPSEPALVGAFAAVAERRQISFVYNDESRTVDPHRLDFQRGRWYITGFDHLRGADRHFRLDRISGELEAGEPGGFDRPAGGEAGGQRQPWELGEGDPLPAKVLVDRDQAAWAQHAAGPDAVVEHRDDGAIVIELLVTNRPAFRSFVLTFLDHAEILEPAVLREDLTEWLELQR